MIAAIVERLYDAFVRFDAMLCEVNPLIVTPGGEVKALDSKFTVDDNALYKHPDIAEMRDTAAADPLEALAREKGVTYVKLDGTVGIVGNGAGLSMSTVDVVVLAGGKPANFLDLGGGGDAEGVVEALEVILQDPQVKSIFFNIFGGITRCDEVARGILAALERMTIEQPIVVRLDGTNAEEGRKVLGPADDVRLHPGSGIAADDLEAGLAETPRDVTAAGGDVEGGAGALCPLDDEVEIRPLAVGIARAVLLGAFAPDVGHAASFTASLAASSIVGDTCRFGGAASARI